VIAAFAATFHGWRPERVLAPLDHYATRVHGADESNHRPANDLLMDQAVQFVPWTDYAAERWRQGEVPLWNPHQQLGAPFLANGQSAVLHPAMLAHLLLPPTWSWTVVAAMRLFLAGLGTWLLARELGLGRAGSLLAALVYELSGYHIVWLNHPHTLVTPFLPWALLGAERLLERVTPLRTGGLALVIFLQFLGGHPGSCVHLLLALVVYAIARGCLAGSSACWKGGLACASALAIGFALAGAQWIPLIDYIGSSAAGEHRGHAVSSVNLWYLLGIVFPWANGYPPDGVTPRLYAEATGLPNTSELAAGFVGAVPLALAALAVALRRRERAVRVLCVLGLVSAAIAVALPGVAHLVALVPGLKATFNRRLLFASALAIALLAGRGLDLLGELRPDAVAVRRLGKLVLAAAAALVLAALLGNAILWGARSAILKAGLRAVERRYAASVDEDGHSKPLEHYAALVDDIHLELSWTAWRLLIPAGALLALGLGLRSAGRAHSSEAGSLVLLRSIAIAAAAAELLAFAVPFNPGAPASMHLASNPALDYLRSRPDRHLRFSATGSLIYPETATGYRINDVRGYDAVTPARTFTWMSRVDGRPSSVGTHLTRLLHPAAPQIALLACRYLVARAGEEPGQPWRLAFAQPECRLAVHESPAALPYAWVAQRAESCGSFENVLERVVAFDFDPRATVLLEESPGELAGAEAEPASVAPASVLVDRPSPEELRLMVDAPPGSWLVVSESFFPGWEARGGVPGGPHSVELPIRPAYGILQAVHLSAELPRPCEIVLAYRPLAWRLGLAASGLGACALLVLCWIGRPRARRKN
jgi:hypothetical protein